MSAGSANALPVAQELSDYGLVPAMDPVIVSYGGNTPTVVFADIVKKSTDQFHDAGFYRFMPSPDLILR